MENNTVIGLILAVGIALEGAPATSQQPPGPDQAALVESGLDLPLYPMQPAGPEDGFEIPDGLQETTVSPMPGSALDDVPPLDVQQIGLLQIPEEADDRMWRLRPVLSTGVTYDDNIFITNTDRTADIIYDIEGGFTFELGDYRTLQSNYLLLEYSASGFFYMGHPAQNSLDQGFSLLGQYRINQAALQLESNFQSLDGADRQVGAFTSRMLFFNSLQLAYQYSEKTSLEFGADQSTSYYPDQLSSYTWEANMGADYRILPKTSIGLQLLAGVNQVQQSPNRTYQTANARTAYELTGKVVLKSSLGLQLNQYQGGGEPMRAIPVFSVGAEYQIAPKTQFVLNAYRNMQASPSLAGQDYIATGLDAGIVQQFSEAVSFGLAGGYENDAYVANTTAVTASRIDNFYFFRPSVSYSFLKNLSATLSYEYRANSSNVVEDSWFDNRLSFDLALEL